jgi:pimeloyl-ACP methyl ester carboxylesterase
MNSIEVSKSSNGEPVRLAYQDLGNGRPVILIHGWPVSHAMWEYQLLELPNHGMRVIAYDRRGFGHSSKPWEGYDYDTLADDLKGLIEGLDLRDVTLVGFSMGGGEVARYMARHGGDRISKVVFVSSVTPYLMKSDDNPDGIDPDIGREILSALKDDRFDFLLGFGKKFFNEGLLKHPVSLATLQWTHSLALAASPKATFECAKAFGQTDFRNDLKSIKVPCLVIHGDADQTVPMEASSARTVELLRNAEYQVYDNAPHGLFITHKDQLNQDLIRFINQA